MKTHTIKTIKQNKTILHRIVTFSPAFMELLKNSQIDAVGVLIHKLTTNLNELTGVKHLINYHQDNELSAHFHLPQPSTWKSILTQRAYSDFVDGYLKRNLCDLEKDLQYLNQIMTMLEKQQQKELSSCNHKS